MYKKKYKVYIRGDTTDVYQCNERLKKAQKEGKRVLGAKKGLIKGF